MNKSIPTKVTGEKKYKVKFEVKYNPVLLVKMSEIMKHLDLGIEKVIDVQTDVVSWTTTTKVTKKYLDKMKKRCKQAYENEGMEVFSVEYIL